MSKPRDRRHIRIHQGPRKAGYTPHPRRVDAKAPESPDDPAAHARKLATALEGAARTSQERRKKLGVQVTDAEPGTYLEFESPPGVAFELERLENRVGKARIELLSVKANEDRSQSAVVFVPEQKTDHFPDRVRQYTFDKTKKGERKNKSLVERIADISAASLEDLWVDDPQRFPSDPEARVWWEVWLRRSGDGREYARFLEFAGLMSISVSERRLQFEDRIVLLAKASSKQLAHALDLLGDVAELRSVAAGAAPFDTMDGPEQVEWVEDLEQRLECPDDDAPAVCILDTGVNRGHRLLRRVLASTDSHAVKQLWGAQDHDSRGHGTAMAGLAAYGDLASALESSGPVVIPHRLESVKILPPTGENEERLYGTITATAANLVEAQAPSRRRCFSMAVTAPDQTHDGRPSSWSAAIDALATGRAFDQHEQGFDYTQDADRDRRRLFVVSAGNVDVPARDDGIDHLDRSAQATVHDPAQAWNALTVGAFTGLATITDPSWEGWNPVAKPGDLSPHSTTSLAFARSSWPLKPDVVFEGGNVATDEVGNFEGYVPDYCLLTTGHEPTKRSFSLANATSAASAQVARMAATLQAEYPDLWPETVRGLIVQSARWTPRMFERLGPISKANMGQREQHVRQFGFGVPSLKRAARSARDALTLIAQQEIQPFEDGGSYADMHLYELPWPTDALVKLDAVTVQLRVTLSYFVEPCAGSRAWAKRYSYASHGLRFKVKPAEQTVEDFEKSLSKDALDRETDEEKPDNIAATGWFLGDQAARRGSVHTNIWTGTAAQLAERNVVAVLGVAGWWKAQKRKGRTAPYSLIVSIESEDASEDIWTPVANQIGVPIETVDIPT